MGRITNLLTVGTTHPLNIAGLGLVARVAPLLGVRIVTVVAGVSAQNAHGVLARQPIGAATISAQFAALAEVDIAGIHVGALVDAQSAVAVADALRRFGQVPIVCDPVIAATGGDRLADDSTVSALRDRLFACCTLITPNLAEAALILGRPEADTNGMEQTARQLTQYGSRAVLLKGGHLAGDPSDVFATAQTTKIFVADRIAGSLRGTGDLLACSIAARLAHGDDLMAAIECAREFVRTCLRDAVSFAGTRTIP